MLAGRLTNTLPVPGLRGLHQLGKTRVVDRHVAPAEELEAFLLEEALPGVLAMGGDALVARHEQVADGVVAGLGQSDAELLALLFEEGVRDLDQDARAVAERGIGADGTAMLEIAQHRQRVRDDAVRLLALEVGDEADATGIAFVGGVEQALGLGALRSCRLRVVSSSSSSVPCGETSLRADLKDGRSAGNRCVADDAVLR